MPNNMPARGQAQPTKTIKVEAIDLNKASTMAIPEPSAPGAEQEYAPTGFNLKGLGDITDVPPVHSTKIGGDIPGEGDRVVILSDWVSGKDGHGYTKGQVRFLSLLIPQWDAEDKTVARRAAARLFNLKAVRLASAEEAEKDFVEVTANNQMDDVQRERDARIRAERELERMKAQQSGNKGPVSTTGEAEVPPGDDIDF